MEKINKTELMKKLKVLDIKDKETRNRIVCSLIGHSKIVDTCMGEVYCGRCEAKIGDTLAGVFPMEDKVIIGHKCKTCEKNYKKVTWKDKLYVPNPFKEG